MTFPDLVVRNTSKVIQRLDNQVSRSYIRKTLAGFSARNTHKINEMEHLKTGIFINVYAR